MYLAEDYWRKNKIPAELTFLTGTGVQFAAPKYAKILSQVMNILLIDSFLFLELMYHTCNQICADRGIKTVFKHDLIEVRGETKEAIFRNLETQNDVVCYRFCVSLKGKPSFTNLNSSIFTARF